MRRFTQGFSAAALAALLLAPAAEAQTGPFRVGGETHQIAISSSASTPEQLTGFSTDQQCSQVLLANIGTVDVYVELAGTSAAAVPDITAAGGPGTSRLLRAGESVVAGSVNKPWISAQTSSGTSTLNATCGTGVLTGTGGTVGISAPTGSSSTSVQGAGAHDSPIVGNPLRGGARAVSAAVTAVTAGDTTDLVASTQGVLATVHDVSGADNASNTHGGFIDRNGTVVRTVGASIYCYDGSTWDRCPGDSVNGIRVYNSAPAAASILAGSQSYTATQAATTIVTIPAGNTWVGQVTINADVAIAAASSTAGQALGVVTTTGAGTTPAAGQVMDCEARSGANAATGTVGSQAANSCTLDMIVNCASGTCTLAGATTQAGTASRVSFSASGRLY